MEYAAENGSKWSVCPPALVQIGDTNSYFLAGQRVPQLLKVLSELTSLEELPQPTSEAPNLVQLQFNSPIEAQQLINDEKVRAVCPLQWAGPAAARLAASLPDLAGYRAMLPTVYGFAESNFIFHKWNGQEFVVNYFKHETGMYRLIPHDLKSRLPDQTLFFDAEQEQSCWRMGAWYDLRYLAQQAAGEICRVIFSHSQQRLSIPANYRWPDIYERALTLASGFLPLPSPDKDWFYFSDISPDLVQTLAKKLNALLEEKP